MPWKNKDDEKRIIQLHSEGKTSREIADIIGVKYQCSVTRFLKRRGLRYPRKKYSFNESYFDKIDTESKAYFLGFLYADGNVSKTNRRYTVRLGLHKKDEEILQTFKKEIELEKPLYYGGTTEMCTLELTGVKIVDAVMSLGVVPNKTFKITFPSFLDRDMLRHFIRGYFDGDGGVCFTKPKRNTRKISNLYFCGTKQFCERLQEILKSECNANFCTSERHPSRKTNIRMLQTGGNRQVQRILDYLYKDATIYLNRKFVLYEELCQINLL